MKTFPMFLQMAGRRVVIVGGGEQAAQKARLMLKTEAEIVLLAHSPEDELTALIKSGRVRSHVGSFGAEVFDNAALVFVATGCPGADRAAHALAKAAGATVNVVDQPEICDALTPSIVDRDPVVVAIGTEGTAPVLGRQIKTQVEQMLEPGLGDLAALAGRLRARAAARLGPRARRDLWRWVFGADPRRVHAAGGQRRAAEMIKAAILTQAFGAETAGSVALVGAGPGAADLMTLRGVQRLQEADVIFYDKDVAVEVLELARRDAERVGLGTAAGVPLAADVIAQSLVRSAVRGRRVVRLRGGGPGTFSHSCVEVAALRQAGIAVEIVPGVGDVRGAQAQLAAG